MPVAAERHEVGQGNELAVAVEVATGIHEDVLAHLRAARAPVGTLLVLRPPDGARDKAVAGARGANGLAVSLRDAVRREARSAPRVHLFLAVPMGLALLLGHRWNRVAPTTVYEDLASDGYEAAFEVSA